MPNKYFTKEGQVIPPMKVYSQASEPTLDTDGKMCIWVDTDDSNKPYLVYRRGSGDQVKTILTTSGAVDAHASNHAQGGSDILAATAIGAVPQTGFVTRTTSTLGMAGSTFQITTGSSYDIYTEGTKYTKSTTQSVSISTDLTLHFVYFDTSGVLQVSTSAWSIIGSNILVAMVYKDGSNYCIFDERHSAYRDKRLHAYLHDTVGARYDVLVGGLTGTFTNTTLSVTRGTIYDEDLANDTGGTKTTTNLYYRNSGLTAMRVELAASTPYKASAGVLQYDNGGTLAGVSNNSYANYWLYATNDITNPLAIVVGQSQSSNLTTIRSQALPSILLSTLEWKLLYRLTYRNAGGTATYTENADYRTSSSLPAGGAPAVNAASVTVVPASGVASTNVQSALEELSTEAFSKSTAAVTYYVRSDGNDANDGLASDSGHSLLTIQAACDKIPDSIVHKYIVDIGAGTFAGFTFQNRMLGIYSGLTTSDRSVLFQGAAFITATLAQGLTTGTVDTGTTRTLDDADANWAVNDLRGRIVTVNATDFIIRSNTATSLEVVGAASGSLTGAYTIKDYATIIQENTSAAIISTLACIRIHNLQGSRAILGCAGLTRLLCKPTSATQGTATYGISVSAAEIYCTYCSADLVNNTTSNSAGFSFIDCTNIRLGNCSSGRVGGQGFVFQNVRSIRELLNVISYATTSYGINMIGVGYSTSMDNIYGDTSLFSGILIQGTGWITGGNWFAKGCTGYAGLWILYGTGYVGITGGTFDSNRYGILVSHNQPRADTFSYIDSGVSFRAYGTVTVSNSVDAGVVADNDARLRLTSVVGTGNGTYGIQLDRGAKVYITGDTTVTGSSGDIYLDENLVSYATHLAQDGNIAKNLDLGTFIKRDD